MHISTEKGGEAEASVRSEYILRRSQGRRNTFLCKDISSVTGLCLSHPIIKGEIWLDLKHKEESRRYQLNILSKILYLLLPTVATKLNYISIVPSNLHIFILKALALGDLISGHLSGIRNTL